MFFVLVLFVFLVLCKCLDVLIFYPRVPDDQQCFIARSARRKKKRELRAVWRLQCTFSMPRFSSAAKGVNYRLPKSGSGRDVEDPSPAKNLRSDLNVCFG